MAWPLSTRPRQRLTFVLFVGHRKRRFWSSLFFGVLPLPQLFGRLCCTVRCPLWFTLLRTFHLDILIHASWGRLFLSPRKTENTNHLGRQHCCRPQFFSSLSHPGTGRAGGTILCTLTYVRMGWSFLRTGWRLDFWVAVIGYAVH